MLCFNKYFPLAFSLIQKNTIKYLSINFSSIILETPDGRESLLSSHYLDAIRCHKTDSKSSVHLILLSQLYYSSSIHQQFPCVNLRQFQYSTISSTIHLCPVKTNPIQSTISSIHLCQLKSLLQYHQYYSVPPSIIPQGQAIYKKLSGYPHEEVLNSQRY